MSSLFLAQADAPAPANADKNAAQGAGDAAPGDKPAAGEKTAGEGAATTSAGPSATTGDKAAGTTASTAKQEKGWYEQGAMGYMIEGGIFMWPILFVGILAAGAILERFRSLRMLRTDSEGLRKKVLELLRDDRVEEALSTCENEQGPVAAILSAGLRKFLVLRRIGADAGKIEEQVVKSMDDYSVHIVAALEKHLPILATASSVAPMLGFLGTVQGMVVSFQDIVSKKGQADIVELAAAGIQVALLTTVFGLVVGIPAFTFYNYFTSLINRFVLEVEESATELIEVVTLEMALRSRDGASVTHSNGPAVSPARQPRPAGA